MPMTFTKSHKSPTLRVTTGAISPPCLSGKLQSLGCGSANESGVHYSVLRDSLTAGEDRHLGYIGSWVGEETEQQFAAPHPFSFRDSAGCNSHAVQYSMPTDNSYHTAQEIHPQELGPLGFGLDTWEFEPQVKRRVGPLSEEARHHATAVRRRGACVPCRQKKVACRHVLAHDILGAGLPELPTVKDDKANSEQKYTEDIVRHPSSNSDISEIHSVSESSSDSDTDFQVGSINEVKVSPVQDSHHILLIREKQHLITILMHEVYAMLDSQRSDNIRSCTSSHTTSSSNQSQDSNNVTRMSQRFGKRQMQDRDSSPPGDGNGKRRRKEPSKSTDCEPGRLLACPFHKYDPRKYCANQDTGATYRACAGPGFASISRVKQHLKRTHRAPIQCQRCWRTMANLNEMSVHANEDRRCDRRDPQTEGISQDKLDLIGSSWGASWETIFGIIFPGAPIPSPYFEAQDQSIRNTAPASPASGEHGDFEAYNRTALPLLVEANLHAIVSTEMAPLEESLRNMLVDIVRRCQATVVQNFQIMKAPRPNSSNATETSPPATQAQSISWTGSETGQPPTLGMTSPPSFFYQEPPHLRDEASLTIPRPSYEAGNQNIADTLFSDSAYASGDCLCDCVCHLDGFMSEAPINSRACDHCAGKHTDPANTGTDDFDDLLNF